MHVGTARLTSHDGYRDALTLSHRAFAFGSLFLRLFCAVDYLFHTVVGIAFWWAQKLYGTSTPR